MDVNRIVSEVGQCKAEIKKVGYKVEESTELILENQEELKESFRRQFSLLRKSIRTNFVDDK